MYDMCGRLFFLPFTRFCQGRRVFFFFITIICVTSKLLSIFILTLTVYTFTEMGVIR